MDDVRANLGGTPPPLNARWGARSSPERHRVFWMAAIPGSADLRRCEVLPFAREAVLRHLNAPHCAKYVAADLCGRKAKQQRATIYWGDEMGLRSDHETATSSGRKTQTPVIPGTGKRFL